MVHFTHSFRPEIVLFGEGQQFKLPLALEAGNSIIVKSQPDGQISVARFRPAQADERRTVKNSVIEVIRAIAAVGGDYPDAVQALQEAHASGALASRLEVDALPDWGRTFERNHKVASSAASPGDTKLASASSIGAKHNSKSAHSETDDSENEDDDSGLTELKASTPSPACSAVRAPKFTTESTSSSDSSRSSSSSGKSTDNSLDNSTGAASKSSSQPADF